MVIFASIGTRRAYPLPQMVVYHSNQLGGTAPMKKTIKALKTFVIVSGLIYIIVSNIEKTVSSLAKVIDTVILMFN
jgi:hypothetical protein